MRRVEHVVDVEAQFGRFSCNRQPEARHQRRDLGRVGDRFVKEPVHLVATTRVEGPVGPVLEAPEDGDHIVQVPR